MTISLQLMERRKGNDAYRKGDNNTALHHYVRAKAVVDLVEGLSHADNVEVIANRITVNCNIAAVQLASKNFGAAIIACNDALELDPQCEKAVSRRAKAYVGRHEYDLAMQDVATLRKINHFSDEIYNIEVMMKRTKVADRKSEESFKNIFK